MNKQMQPGVPIACFVSRKSPGHAAQAARMMRAVYKKWPFVQFHVFTTLAESLFKQHLGPYFSFHWYPAEVRAAMQPGMATTPAAVSNCPVATRPEADGSPAVLARRLAELDCLMVISDAGRWGLDAAKKAGIPRLCVDGFSGEGLLKACVKQFSDNPARIPAAGDGCDTSAELLCRWLAAHHELLEVVSPDGKTVGAAPRSRVHGNNALLHRVVHALVFDDAGRLLLQKRSFSKTVAPGKWDTSVGGHVDCGESVETALHREMAEELGISPRHPRFAHRYIHSNSFESELVHTYICGAGEGLRFNPDEIEALRFWDTSEIAANLGSGLFSDNFEHEFAIYRQADVMPQEKGAKG